MILIKLLSVIFWLAVTVLTGYLAVEVLKTETDPQKFWAWMTLCSFFFLSASLLCWLMLTAGRKSR